MPRFLLWLIREGMRAVEERRVPRPLHSHLSEPHLLLRAQLEATFQGKSPVLTGVTSPSRCHLLPWAPTCSPARRAPLPSALACDLTWGLVPYN